MKTALTILLSIISIQILAQKCNCSSKSELKEIISCDKTVFKNGAELFWSFDCNSSWLTFQNKKNKKIIFNLNKDLMNLTGRLGFSNWKEYKNSFLIENRVISGCCDPSEFYLFNKENGNKIANLGTSLYETENKEKKPFIITLSDLNTILYTDLNTNKIIKIPLPKDRLQKSLGYSDYLFAEYLFDNGNLNKNIFSIKYKYKTSKNSKWENEIIKIDTKKYGR